MGRFITLGFVLCALPISALLGQLFAETDRGAYLLLGLAYGFFATPMVLWPWLNAKPFKWILSLFCAATALGLICMLLLEKSHLYPLYPLATTLAYAILLIVLLLAVNRWIFSKPHSLSLHFQKRYIIYGFGLLALFFATTTMDQSTPFGPHFQLRVLVWILLTLLILNWFLGQWRMVKALESAKISAELTHLKSQIQPHFLFNTLNNLYGLARENSEMTAEMILKLSELLRYGLYQANKEQVPLTKEIEYLRNYLTLQQLRHAAGVDISFRVEPGVGSEEISPLLLIPLLENAFKHGADHLSEGAFIHLELSVVESVLKFTVENNAHPNKQHTQPGLGLENLQKRLELIYPNRHEFTFACNETRAKAELIIQL